ncbi:MAG: hypothetical protein LLF76_06175 [Planctomycetaceae bacterium]|nr:hypothetical protein [Planctomycetaceae bacterium]
MNDNIETKLNELLKMKDELDALKSQRTQQEAVDDFQKKQKTLKLYYYLWMTVCVFILLAGIGGLENNSEAYKLNGLFIALVGLNGVLLMKLWYFIKLSNLYVLQELKQLRLQLANQTAAKNQ